MLKVWILFPRQWEFIEVFNRSEPQSDFYFRSVCWQNGESILEIEQVGAGAVIQVRNDNGVSLGGDSEDREKRMQLKMFRT